MQLFLLGAGRPANGDKPTALKNITLETKAMDWQIHSFESTVDIKDIYFLGGYHVDEVTSNYPQLNISFVPDWDNKGVLHTLFKAPLTNKAFFTAYSDTVFRNEIIENMSSIEADVVFGVDSLWEKRYEDRTEDDILAAETIVIGDVKFEFTGLIKFSSRAAQYISELEEENVGGSLIDLVSELKEQQFNVVHFDVTGDWAEFNSSSDIARFILGTKAETLARLEPIVKKSHIGRQINFTTSNWVKDPRGILELVSQEFKGEKLVIRSSSKGEDNWYSSNAGGFESLLNINADNSEELECSINEVITSYGQEQNGDDQVLVQPFLTKVKLSGVVFTCSLETGAPYYRFNFDDKTQSTESVTAGTHSDLRTVLVNRLETKYLESVAPELLPVMEALKELELLLGYDKLDIEFAIDDKGTVHIFQVRPVTVNHEDFDINVQDIADNVSNAVDCFNSLQNKPPHIHGESTIFANMPDWNPAEIIGTRPKPLSFSLYRQLITNDVWAQQRVEFGYRDVRPNPLIVSFAGQPYVDARASLNSFIPSSLPEESANRIVNAYINILSDNPEYHDKIEFDVAFTVWTHDFKDNAKNRLLKYGVTPLDIEYLEKGLKDLTCKALKRLTKDIASIELLESKIINLQNSNLRVVDKIYSLLDDCKRHGTLAFSHAARAGFVATTLLNAFVTTDVLSDERRLLFLRSFDTVAGDFEKDKAAFAQGELSLGCITKKYGHLRPGTYEVTAQAYWEEPSKYFSTHANTSHNCYEEFVFTQSELGGIKSMITELGSDISPLDLIAYIKSAIIAREFVKFEFTRNLSLALDYCVSLGKEVEIEREDLSYLEYHDIELLKLNAITVAEIKTRIQQRKKNYSVTCSVELPPLIKTSADFYSFERFSLQPNFVTNNKIDGLVKCLEGNEASNLSGRIIMIPQADPGYDWLFGHGIAGLITKYGGANSHMAIRAAEIGLPAAIGVGDKLYEKISNMKYLELDCTNQIIREI